MAKAKVAAKKSAPKKVAAKKAVKKAPAKKTASKKTPKKAAAKKKVAPKRKVACKKAAPKKEIMQHIDLDSCDLVEQVNTIREVAKTTGCIVIRGSQFEKNFKNMQTIQKQLDKLYTSKTKNQVGCTEGDGATRGFFQLGVETGDKKNVEQKESFSFGYEGIPKDFLKKNSLVAENIWPKSCKPANFQELMDDMNKTATDILKLLQLAFPNIPLLSTIDKTSLYQSFCRSYRYYPRDVKGWHIGNSLHSDWNLLTLVWTDKPGLQVLYNDDYISYNDKDRGYSLICNYGDFISAVSKGVVASPWHRVMMNEEERNSLVYLLYPKHSMPAVKNKTYIQDKLLSLFVDQSSADKKPWKVPNEIKNMWQMYSAKWTQVSVKK